MKHLVVGGAGFIGCNIADHLLSQGNEVIIYDNLSRRGTIDNYNWLKNKYPRLQFVQGDIRIDIERLQQCVNDCDVVYHFAGQVAVTTSVKNPREDFDINALGTFNVLECVRQAHNQPILLYSSTNKVYGGMEDVVIVEDNQRYKYRDFPQGIDENRLLDFHSPYGCSKGTGDQYVRDYSRIYGLKTIVFRQSCIYGARQFGIEDQGWVAWFTIASILNKKITIYGDGKQVRDILFVDDLARAYEMAVRNIHKTAGRIYNVGGGPNNTMSLLELINYLEIFLNKKLVYSFRGWRPGDQKVYVSNIDKARLEFGWEPQISVSDGVRRLYDWALSHKDLFLDL